MTPHQRLWFRRLGVAAGLMLLAAAVIVVVRQHAIVAAALDAMRDRPRGQAIGLGAVLMGSIVLNLALSGLLFSVLIAPWGRVGRMEMQALIAATALMNYLPLPGFVGRMAYHKGINNIAIRDSGRTVLQAMAMSVFVAGWFALSIVLATRSRVPLPVPALVPLPTLAVAAWMSRGQRRTLSLALLIRYVDALVTAGRYFAAFSLVGAPIGVQGALAFAGVGMIATLVPFVGNGLGLREWAVGLAAPLLTGYQFEQGIVADLVNRAAEMIIFLALGLLAIAWLARRRPRMEAITASGAGSTPGG